MRSDFRGEQRHRFPEDGGVRRSAFLDLRLSPLAHLHLDAELAHDIATVATELVTNSVRHCRVTLAQVEVTLSIRGCGLLVEVSDPDRERIPTLPAGADEEETGGRGLLLVAGVTDHRSWGPGPLIGRVRPCRRRAGAAGCRSGRWCTRRP
ncbi:ATP-binding protein [Streptomyces dysideae]|uniref:ATP-binding protein n=1 Tax=Streptomyces dysideae TaxID=909626 RepID=UPI00099E6E30|nr:ATP-binding protein [Streptomyces dysideae]